MSARTEAAHRKLSAALDATDLVWIERRPRSRNRVDGFVVGVGSKWALIAVTMDGGFFDGFAAIRLRDVTLVRRNRSFESTFARTQPEWPPTMPAAIDLDSSKAMMRDLALMAPLIAIEKEHERWATWIGELVNVKRGWVALREVRPDATWRKRPLWYELRAVTKVSVGNHYLVALAATAGAPPPRRS
jgi:hypothetical protein